MTVQPKELDQAFELLFGNSRDAVAVSSEGRVVFANAACRDLYRAESDEDFVGRTVMSLIAPTARQMVAELLRRRASGEPLPPTYRIRSIRADGTEFDNELWTTSFERGGVSYIITLQREVAAPLPSPGLDDSFYRAVFQVNTAIKLLIDPQSGEIVDANQAAVEFYGHSIDTLREMLITDINQLSASEVEEEMSAARAGRRRYFRFRHRLASGDIRHVEVYSGPITIGDRVLLFSIIHDVTERDALAEQLQASQHLEAVGRLAGGIAHEFNNLLMVALNGSAMLLRKMPADSPLRRYVEDMSFASERAADLTRDLLAFSRRQVMKPEVLDLNAVVERMAAMLQRSIGRRVTLVMRLEAELPSAQCDPRQLEHLLMNLVLNARDAMPTGGRIEVSTRAISGEATAAESGPQSGDWVQLTVTDEGEGMDEATRKRLFEPFFTTKGERKGTGLGMATVYGIVKQSGGHIAVTSAPSEGTTIDVYLPVSNEERAPVREETAVDHEQSATLLLVEDEELVRRVLSNALESMGFTLLLASSVDEALAVWRERCDDIDALVTDVVMPGRSGIELVNVLRAERPALPVVVVSGDLQGHDLTALPKTACCLQKPITGTQLAEELTALLDGAQRG